MAVPTLSSNFGENIRLDKSYRSAKRPHSFNYGMIFSKDPLPRDQAFQFKLQPCPNNDWGGTVKFGVTSISPDQARFEKTASDLKGLSFILCTEEGATCLFISGRKVLQFPSDVSLQSLGVGNIAGVQCNTDRILSFFLDGTCLRIKLPPSLRMPKVLHGVIDLYGQCTAIELVPIDHSSSLSSSRVSFEIDEENVRPVLEELARKEESSRRIKNKHSQGHTSDTETFTQQVFPVVSSPLNPYDTTTQLLPPQFSQAVPTLPVSLPAYVQPKCEYRELCLGFLKDNLVIKDYYFDSQYDKCYCSSCVQIRREPTLKSCGEHHSKRYATPVGWFKFGLKMIKEHHARDKDSFNKWHKAYHGTEVSRMDSILDSGQLLPPGTHTTASEQVERPKGHFNEYWKPDHHDPNQIFFSPSIKYSTYQEVYAKSSSYTDTRTDKSYRGKVCLKVLIEPNSYRVSEQTVRSDGQQVDELFSNGELEWSTKHFTQVYLYGLMVRMEPAEN